MEDEWQDILSNGAVLKQTIRASPFEEKVSPEYKQEVTVHLVGRVQKDPSRVFQDTRKDGQPITTFVGDNILDLLPPGLMLVVRSMNVGDLARVKLASRFAFGLGAPWLGLEEDLDVEYEIELLNVGEIQKEVPEMTLEELEKVMALCKTRGNEFYKFAQYDKALRCYKEGVRYGDGALQHMQDEEQPIRLEDKAVQDRLACLNNIATVLEKQGKLKEAMESTVMVLESDPRHLKSLVRAARIAVQQGSHEEASAAVAAAVAIAPSNPAVVQVKADLEARIEKHKKLEKERWGGFLKPIPPEEAERLRKLEEERRKAAANATPPESPSPAEPSTTIPGRRKQEIKIDDAEDEDDLLDGLDHHDGLAELEEAKQNDVKSKSFIPAEFLELLARLVVLLSPSIISLLAMLLWALFAT